MVDKLQSIILHDVSKTYDAQNKQHKVLTHVSYIFAPGVSYAIRGVSGSGKSTLLHLLSGLDEPSSGTVTYGKTPLAHLGDAFRQSTIGFMFQHHYLINELPVIENIMLPGLVKGTATVDCQERAAELLCLVDLADKALAYPAELSGGQQQRVALARALFNKPLFLLADEPTGNLDAENAQRIVDVLIAASCEWGMGIILCSHDEAVYGRMSTVLHLVDGQLVLEKGPN
jgi:lipoprotein-releasing system ATP-binding protein